MNSDIFSEVFSVVCKKEKKSNIRKDKENIYKKYIRKSFAYEIIYKKIFSDIYYAQMSCTQYVLLIRIKIFCDNKHFLI